MALGPSGCVFLSSSRIRPYDPILPCEMTKSMLSIATCKRTVCLGFLGLSEHVSADCCLLMAPLDWLIPATSFTSPLFQRTPSLGAVCRTETDTSPGKTFSGPICLCQTDQREMNQKDQTKWVVLEKSVLCPSFYKIREKHFIFLSKSKFSFQ